MTDIRRPYVTRGDIRRFGAGTLHRDARAELIETTRRLVDASPDSVVEFGRYLGVMDREITLPVDRLTERLGGRTVVVTGDSGCIGSALVRQLARFGVERVVGVSLEPGEGAESHRLDIRDGAALSALLSDVAPDIVFHLAAQRDPGLAETAVATTVTTNAIGTRNVVRACELAGVPQLVHASTGKALRPYTTCVYAASKRLSERIVADATVRGTLHGSSVRFTHVVDNAILLSRLRGWCASQDTIRLHSLDTLFYAQSAVESAQLLLVAALAPSDGAFRVHSIRDLDWPFKLLDLALGVIAESGYPVPVQEIGCEPGYERTPYAGLFDPAYSGDVSPLLNAIEAPTVTMSASPDVDAACDRRTMTRELWRRLSRTERVATAAEDSPELRSTFDELAQADLRQTISETSDGVLARLAWLTAPHRRDMIEEHLRIDDAVRGRLAALGRWDDLTHSVAS